MQFPITKTLLNQWHVADILQQGLFPRTRRRNNITHFDECGVVLAVANDKIPNLLRRHLFKEAFFDNRQEWGHSVCPFVFGHANLEMMLNPFIGLTGKWFAVPVEQTFFKLDYAEQLAELDVRLSEQLSNKDLISSNKPFKPIPLLGIPGWYGANQRADFYQNTDYFRPLNHQEKQPHNK